MLLLYCPGGETETKCAGNLMSPAGSRKEGDCGKILHVGNGQMYVHLDSPDASKPALAVRIDDTTYYANLGTDNDVMTLNSNRKLHIKTSTKNYTAFDNSVLYSKPSE